MDVEDYPFCEIVLKPFSEEKSQTLLAIRNEESVRKGMLNRNPISWEDHTRWVKKNVIDNCKVRIFFVAYRNDIAGFSLLKALPDNHYEIGLMLKQQYIGTRTAFLSAIATAKYSFERLGNSLLISKVPKTNAIALDFNQRMGLEIYDEDGHCYFLRMTPTMFFEHRFIGWQLKKSNSRKMLAASHN
jgi:hypothetical protein